MKNDVFMKNREKFLKKMTGGSVVVLFAGKAPHKTGDESHAFTPNRNYYYLTGIPVENGIAVFTKEEGTGVTTETLFIEPSNPVLAKWVGEKMSREEAAERSGVDEIELVDGFRQYLHKLFGDNQYHTLGLDFEQRKNEGSNSAIAAFLEQFSKEYPYIKLANISPEIHSLRVIKSEEELEELQKAIEITKAGVEHMMKNASPGMYEYELEACFDYILKSNGVKDFAFKTIAAAGKNGTILHYTQNHSKSTDGDLILCDLGAQWGYYSADITRTFPLSGVYSTRQREIYSVVLKAHDEVIKRIKPGETLRSLNERCKEVLTEGCIKLGLISSGEELSNYYYHGVSHFLGLDTHDVGNREQPLMPGMVITVEPGLYIEQEQIGIRIEDDVLVLQNGAKVLSDGFLTDPDEIEAFMKK